MPDISDSWSCPRCLCIWTRSKYQSREQWQITLRRAQEAHGIRCEREKSVQ